jgi:hypothetical protein
MPNANINDVLNSIKDDAATDTKQQFQQLITNAKGDANGFIQSNANQLEAWLVALSNGSLPQDEFNNLVAGQKLVAADFVATQALDAQLGAENLTVNLLETAVTKIVPLLI